MSKDKHFTTVIFRKFKTGDIIALFPEIPADKNAFYCESYQHIGQHGASCANLNSITTLATVDDYKSLARELKGLGYRLRILSRVPSDSASKRRRALKIA
jgi:hypothetical protein